MRIVIPTLLAWSESAVIYDIKGENWARGRTGRWSLQQLSPDQLFLAFDSSELPAGCSLEAVVDNGREGKSRPFSLARLVRLPKIDSFTVTTDRLSGLHEC